MTFNPTTLTFYEIVAIFVHDLHTSFGSNQGAHARLALFARIVENST